MKIILFFKYLPHIAAFSVASVNVLNLAPQNFVFNVTRVLITHTYHYYGGQMDTRVVFFANSLPS